MAYLYIMSQSIEIKANSEIVQPRLEYFVKAKSELVQITIYYVTKFGDLAYFS